MRTDGLIGAALIAVTAALIAFGIGLPLPHGTGHLPPGDFRLALAIWMTLGSVGLWLLGGASAAYLPRLAELARRGSDARWMLATAALALVLGVLTNQLIFLGLPVSQDESVYRFGAEIIGSARLYAESLPDRIFYANNLIINDGKWYPQYFIGWPILLAPFMKLGVPGLANPVYFAATVPAVFLLCRDLGGLAGRLGAILFATAPLAVFGAGTSLSHTTTLGLLCWVAVVALRARSPLTSALLAVLFCAAFFIRPTTALGIGGPFLILWGVGRARDRDLASVVGFVLPALVLAALFLLVNQLQNGSPFQVAYQRYLEHARETGFRFTSVRRAAEVANFRFEPWRLVGIPAEALFRLNYASLGWPFTLLFALPAWKLPAARVYIASLFGMLGIHCMLDATGMDLFGPVHFFEALLPLLLLVVAGLVVLWRQGRHGLVGAALFAAVLAPITYAPTRIQNMHGIASAQAGIYALTDGLDHAIVFVDDGRFTQRCQSKRLRIRHNFRPENPLDLQAPVLWLNSLNPERTRAFAAKRHPDRTAYRLVWNKRRCQARLEPL